MWLDHRRSTAAGARSAPSTPHGLSPAGYTVNIALHAGVSLLLFALVRSIGGSLVAAGVAGSRSRFTRFTGGGDRHLAPGTAGSLLLLLAMHFHRLAPGARVSARLSCRHAACFACALLSTESVHTLILPVMDALCPANDLGVRSNRAPDRHRPPLGAAVAYLLVRRAVLGSITTPRARSFRSTTPAPITTTPLAPGRNGRPGVHDGAAAPAACRSRLAGAARLTTRIADSACDGRAGWPVCGRSAAAAARGARLCRGAATCCLGSPRADVLDREQRHHHDGTIGAERLAPPPASRAGARWA